MSYESPIKIITDLNYKIIEDQQKNIVKAIRSYGIDISKDELFKLLYDDRKQYDKGYSDGYTKTKEEIVRCKDCKHRILNENYSETDIIYNKAECELDTGDPYELGRNAWDDNWFCADGERKDEMKENE